MDSCFTFQEWIAYTELELGRWKQWFTAHPEALDLNCDVAKAGTVRRLLEHVFATDLFFAHQLLDLPLPDLEHLSSRNVEELFANDEQALAKFRQFIQKATAEDWETVNDTAGFKASKRKMMTQALWHGVHHRGQLATFLRQQGFEGMWIHDVILTDVMK